jgi:NitT/TauT family transport system substrate-binding protein
MTEKVRIGIATPAGMTAANGYFSAASALGFDQEEGLEFDFFYGEEPATTAKALCSGECDIASLNTTVGLLGRDEGLPMKAVYGKARRTHRWFAVLPDAPIHSLADLRGKRIACDFPHLQALAESALAEENVPRCSYQWVSWRGSGMETLAMLDPLREGEVDAVFLIDWNAGDFIANGLFLRRLPSKALDRIRLSSCLWATESYLADKSRAVLGTGRAMARITVFALENPEEAVRLMWKRHPEIRPSPRDHDRIRRRDLEIMKARLDSFRIDPTDPDPRWGIIAEREITAWQNFLLASGAIKQRLDPKVFFTNQFLADYSRFDAAQIRNQARDSTLTE